MKWRWWNLAVLLGIFSQVGCVSLFPIQSQPPEVGTLLSKQQPKQHSLSSAKSAEACLTTARAMEKNGYELQAIQQYEKARNFDPSLKKIAARLAVLYDRLGNQQQAHIEFQKAAKENPRDANLFNNLGYHYYNKGQLKKAEEMYKKAIALNQEHVSAWNNLGLVLAQLKRIDESLKAYETVMSPAQARCNVAFSLTTQGQREEARQMYQEALKLDPSLRLAYLAVRKLESNEESNVNISQNSDANISQNPAVDSELLQRSPGSLLPAIPIPHRASIIAP